jgi:hypothetical protein
MNEVCSTFIGLVHVDQEACELSEERNFGCLIGI